MKNFCHCHVIGILVSSKTYVEEELPSVSYSDCEPVSSIKGDKDLSFSWMKKFRKGSDDFSNGKGNSSSILPSSKFLTMI